MRILVVILLLSLLGVPLATAGQAVPQLVVSTSNDFYIYRDNGRYYVIGSRAARDTYLTTGQIPYTLTLLGAGPMGETVVFEIDQNNPLYVETLQKKFTATEIAYIFY